MKKIAITALLALVSTGVFAENTAINISPSKIVLDASGKAKSNLNWEIRNPTDIVTINNQVESYMSVLVAADKAFYDNSFIYDPINVNCNGKNIIVQPGSSVICPIGANSLLTIQVAADAFKHGAKGTYVVL